MGRGLTVIFLIFLLSLAPVSPAPEAHERPPEKAPDTLLEGATREIMRTLQLFLNAIPQYKPPEILENGDIIIRRTNPRPKKRPPPPGSGDTSEPIKT